MSWVYALVLNLDVSKNVVIIFLRNEMYSLFKFRLEINVINSMHMRDCQNSMILYACLQLVPTL